MSGVATALSGLAKRGLALVYPEVCQLCRDESAQPADGYVGTDCLEKMKPIEAPFCRRCGQPFEGEITGEFECTNCREMKLRFEFARGVMRGSNINRHFGWSRCFGGCSPRWLWNKSARGGAIALCRCRFIRYGFASAGSTRRRRCVAT